LTVVAVGYTAVSLSLGYVSAVTRISFNHVVILSQKPATQNQARKYGR